MVNKVLVANRGEIARRIFRTCARMGIGTVAVHSDPDSSSPHVSEAEESVNLPGSAPSETYLDIDALLSAAKATGADAVHPGYGFLSESAEFAEAAIGANLTWIGPTPASIAAMGSKLESKRIMTEAGIPVLESAVIDGSASLDEAAASIGFPLLVKASAGGGGKGMRVVDSPDDLATAVDSAKRESRSAFGDDTVFLERYLDSPRHIEIQVFGDTHGNVISLFERECSIQRRHQKIIEESPSVAIDETTRAAMSTAAIEAARAVEYVGAGTVEFLFQDGEFFFLEMNTRLQVEHPVTEMITGLDLVEMQIEVARGEPLAMMDPTTSGHAIEARVYAEDPLSEFLPVTGTVKAFDFVPARGLRVDSGVEWGSEISVHYDPMLAKVVAHAPTRDEAAALLARSLRQAKIHGLTTNRALLVRILEHEEFLEGSTDTHFLDRNLPSELGRPLAGPGQERLAAVACALADQAFERAKSKVLGTIPSGWRNVRVTGQSRAYQGYHGEYEVEYTVTGESAVVTGIGEIPISEIASNGVSLGHDGVEHIFSVARYGLDRYVDSVECPAHLVELARYPTADIDDEVGSLHAPMPGKILQIGVAVGDEVEDGQVLIVMEAMKMEHTLRAPHGGIVTELRCQVGDQVEGDAVLAVVDEA
ncbi:MAG: biotin carboxylase N-terminal domain-containing protein [Acidimicrobiia bacterium]|nr:biotin carboxylase N-terminal domain-containing protein [Acidimicrobiia bacterium]